MVWWFLFTFTKKNFDTSLDEHNRFEIIQTQIWNILYILLHKPRIFRSTSLNLLWKSPRGIIPCLSFVTTLRYIRYLWNNQTLIPNDLFPYLNSLSSKQSYSLSFSIITPKILANPNTCFLEFILSSSSLRRRNSLSCSHYWFLPSLRTEFYWEPIQEMEECELLKWCCGHGMQSKWNEVEVLWKRSFTNILSFELKQCVSSGRMWPIRQDYNVTAITFKILQF